MNATLAGGQEPAPRADRTPHWGDYIDWLEDEEQVEQYATTAEASAAARRRMLEAVDRGEA